MAKSILFLCGLALRTMGKSAGGIMLWRWCVLYPGCSHLWVWQREGRSKSRVLCSLSMNLRWRTVYNLLTVLLICLLAVHQFLHHSSSSGAAQLSCLCAVRCGSFSRDPVWCHLFTLQRGVITFFQQKRVKAEGDELRGAQQKAIQVRRRSRTWRGFTKFLLASSPVLCCTQKGFFSVFFLLIGTMWQPSSTL